MDRQDKGIQIRKIFNIKLFVVSKYFRLRKMVAIAILGVGGVAEVSIRKNFVPSLSNYFV